jgi:hypothetical protein
MDISAVSQPCGCGVGLMLAVAGRWSRRPCTHPAALLTSFPRPEPDSSVAEIADPGVLVASVGFSYFLGRCQLSRTDAQRLGQGPYRPRRRRGSASLQASDGERMHARATGKLGLREELTQSNAAEIIGEGHRSADATISGVPCKLLVESKFGGC